MKRFRHIVFFSKHLQWPEKRGAEILNPWVPFPRILEIATWPSITFTDSILCLRGSIEWWITPEYRRQPSFISFQHNIFYLCMSWISCLKQVFYFGFTVSSQKPPSPLRRLHPRLILHSVFSVARVVRAPSDQWCVSVFLTLSVAQAQTHFKKRLKYGVFPKKKPSIFVPMNFFHCWFLQRVYMFQSVYLLSTRGDWVSSPPGPVSSFYRRRG